MEDLKKVTRYLPLSLVLGLRGCLIRVLEGLVDLEAASAPANARLFPIRGLL